jgi:antitoxin ParD1/3/4
MTSMNISLPESMKTFVEEQVAAGCYGTTSEYLRALIREDQKTKARARLAALLQEGIDSGPATTVDWDGLRRRVHEQLGKRGSEQGDGGSRSTLRPCSQGLL